MWIARLIWLVKRTQNLFHRRRRRVAQSLTCREIGEIIWIKFRQTRQTKQACARFPNASSSCRVPMAYSGLPPQPNHTCVIPGCCTPKQRHRHKSSVAAYCDMPKIDTTPGSVGWNVTMETCWCCCAAEVLHLQADVAHWWQGLRVKRPRSESVSIPPSPCSAHLHYPFG